MWDFCLEHTSDLVAAIKQATGFDYDNRALRKDMTRACLVMYMYLSHAEIPTDAETKPIGIAHLVASFASILHQRSSKAAVVKKSVKYTSSVADPQRQLDLFLSRSHDISVDYAIHLLGKDEVPFACPAQPEGHIRLLQGASTCTNRADQGRLSVAGSDTDP